jgi:hypothetical protein
MVVIGMVSRRFIMKRELIAIDPRDHNKRIVYDSKLEAFYFQEKTYFVWKEMDCTFDVEHMRQWRAHHRLAWVSTHFKGM